MKYPKPVQEKIDYLNLYTESETETKFRILHLYPKKLAYPNGYYDARWVEVWGFNPTNMTKKYLGEHDAVSFYGKVPVDKVLIFADGSTLIRFSDDAQVLYNSTEIQMEIAK